MLIIRLSQDNYSEAVLRKSLYWSDPDTSWMLGVHEGFWVISVEEPVQSFEATLHRYLNDFLLREKLDVRTRSLREDLIKASLHAVMLNVSKA